MISFVHRHVYELFDHFFENLNGFLNPYSRSSRFFVLNFTPFITLMSKVGCNFSFFSMCHLSNQEHSCLKCVPSTTRASHMKRQHPPPHPNPPAPNSHLASLILTGRIAQCSKVRNFWANPPRLPNMLQPNCKWAASIHAGTGKCSKRKATTK